MSTSVLYDVPGPRAITRNRVIGFVSVVVVLAVVGFVLYRFLVTGQLTATKWNIFSYSGVWEQILPALGRTLGAFAAAAVASLVFAIVFGLGRMSEHAWVRIPCTVIIELFRAIPVLVFMMIMYYGMPTIGQTWVTPYLAVVVALTAYNGSVLAEVIRAGVQALPRGQSEAAYAIGLRKSGVMRLILLPQAIRSMLPVIIAQLVVTLKDTALGFIITYPELLYFAKLLGGAQQFDRPIIPVTIVIGAIYITMCLILSGIAKWVESRLHRSQRPVVLPPKFEGTATSFIATQSLDDETK